MALRNLTPDNAYIFRIVHRDNVGWIFDHGLYCKNAPVVDPSYVTIGNPELIEKRSGRSVDCPPGGTLCDYIPFYFTPRSPMLLNIKTGWGGIRRRSNHEIVILASSLRKLAMMHIPFVFTDRHAYLATARPSSDLSELQRIDWDILQRSDFKKDPDDPGKFERYQAEALVYRHMPANALLGITCYDEGGVTILQRMASERGLAPKVVQKPEWYF